jgi:hypothetical protein
MRFLRIAMCVLVLTLSVAGQEGPQENGSSDPQAGTTNGSSNSQNDPGQLNPLEEKTAKASETKAGSQPSSFDVSGSTTSGQDTVLGEVRLMTRYTQIGGDASKSFHVAGSNTLAEFNYFQDRHFMGTRRLQIMTMLRSTDDSSIDPERTSLQRAYLRLFGPKDEYILGDTLVTFSRLSFNQNIKGLSVARRLNEHWKLSGVSGVYIDRYGSLYKELPSRPYMAVVNGGRLEYDFMRDSALGVNFSSSSDQTGTLPPAAVGVAPFPAINKVASVDGKLQFPKGLRLDGEFAYSFTDFDRRLPRPAQPAATTGNTGRLGGAAGRQLPLEAADAAQRLVPLSAEFCLGECAAALRFTGLDGAQLLRPHRLADGGRHGAAVEREPG